MFFFGQNLKRIHDSLSDETMTSAEENKLNETNDEIKTKRNAFSLVSDVFVEESMFFFNAELKISYQQFLTFLNFHEYVFNVILKSKHYKETSLL